MKNRFALALASVALLSFPWLGGSGVTLLFALVPLMVIQYICQARGEGYKGSKKQGKRRRPRLLWWVVGTFALWNALTVWWIANAATIGLVAAIIIGTTLQTVAFMLYDYTVRRGPKVVAYVVLTSAWIALEHLFMIGELSFPWLMFGNGFANDTWAAQWYEYTGAYGGSLWVLLSNILLFELMLAPKKASRRLAAGVAVLLPVAVSITIYTMYKEPVRGVVVSVIQPNIDPYAEKFVIGQDEQNAVMLSLAVQSPPDAKFIIAPETAIDDQIWEEDFSYSQSIQEFQGMIRGFYPGATYITGATTMRRYSSAMDATPTARRMGDARIWYDVYNSALYIDSTDKVRVHHKSILVAGVEKMPFYGVMKNLDFLTVSLGGITGQLGVDMGHRVFTSTSGIVSAAAICYESIYGEYFSGFVNKGAEIMFVITNDGWWGDTPGYRQHFSYSRLRAIETRRSIARSANTGISALINPRGDVVAKLGWDERGIVSGELPLSAKLTFYTRNGDYIAGLSWYVAGLSLLCFAVMRVSRRPRKK